MSLAVDRDWLAQRLDELGEISSEPAPVVTRVVFGEADLRARAFVKQLCRAAGLSLREDAIGNTFARWEGAESGLTAVATGSHIDAIPNAGRFDGTVGVLGGLEAIRALQRSGFRPRRSIELVLFTSEEPTLFGIGCLGSRLMSGTLSAERAAALRNQDGRTLDEIRHAAGFHGPLDSVRLRQGAYHAFIELHIEQGPMLERLGLSIGAVTAIAAPASVRLTFAGEGGHAGAVLMPGRRDAFLAAAEVALEVERAALETGSPDSVGTTGVCRVFPGAINSVPSRSQIELDIRDIDGARRDGMLQRVQHAAGKIAACRGIEPTWELLNADPPARCAPEIIAAVREAAPDSVEMISRAYHDSLFMARIAPTGMIFIPCRNGFSHRPDEYASPDAIAEGALVLAKTLRALS